MALGFMAWWFQGLGLMFLWVYSFGADGFMVLRYTLSGSGFPVERVWWKWICTTNDVRLWNLPRSAGSKLRWSSRKHLGSSGMWCQEPLWFCYQNFFLRTSTWREKVVFGDFINPWKQKYQLPPQVGHQQIADHQTVGGWQNVESFVTSWGGIGFWQLVSGRNAKMLQPNLRTKSSGRKPPLASRVHFLG